MTAMNEPTAPCYREPTNGVNFTRNAHRIDCAEPECRGCVTCPGRHCTARKSCTWHTSKGELTCGRCIAELRRELRWVGELSALLMTQAIGDGVNSEAANLAGPAADPRSLTEWQVARKHYLRSLESHGRITESQHLHAITSLPEDDEHHPYAVLTRWQMMLAEDYGHDMPARLSIVGALDYLSRNLHRVAHDDEQDFSLLKREMKKCRQHLESVLHNDTRRDRGAPCPTCRKAGKVERLERHYSHWCESETCERFHFTDDGSDVWRCPKEKAHWWTQKGYADEVLGERGA